jgi:hypothetical protein
MCRRLDRPGAETMKTQKSRALPPKNADAGAAL